MNKEILKNILATPSIEFSYEEIQALLDEEFEKAVEEMDTELVELCIEVLSQKENFASEKKAEPTICKTKEKAHSKRHIKRLFLIAAVVTLLSIITVSVSAKVFVIDTESGIVTIFGKQISLDLTKNQNEKVFAELEADEISDAYLLPIFQDKNCKLELTEKGNDYHKLDFRFSDTGISGYITIREYNSVGNILDSVNLYSDIEQVKQLSIDDTDIILTSSTDSKTVAYYNKGNNTYKIMFKYLTIDEVVNILQNS